MKISIGTRLPNSLQIGSRSTKNVTWCIHLVMTAPAISERDRRKIVRLVSAVADMEAAIDAGRIAADPETPDVLRSHAFEAMVIAYGSPFTDNHRVGNIGTEFPNYPDFGDAEMPLRHSRLIDMRHKFVAHSSAEGTKIILVPGGVANPLTGESKPDPDFVVGKREFPEPQFAQWLLEAPIGFKGELLARICEVLTTAIPGDATESFEIEVGGDTFQWSI
ncbi:MAG: hypothetical protein HKN82_04380 [Akkermansiaceae bacterium]|nr:hypothetical protein [Akkermansiaceae bacterium]